VASFRGIDVYNYEREGGLSWAAPYLAGLAALAFQVNPKVTPAELKKLLVETASRTDAGRVVNPKAFIAAVKKIKK
jgi:subtilisin family serine protease